MTSYERPVVGPLPVRRLIARLLCPITAALEKRGRQRNRYGPAFLLRSCTVHGTLPATDTQAPASLSESRSYVRSPSPPWLLSPRGTPRRGRLQVYRDSRMSGYNAGGINPGQARLARVAERLGMPYDSAAHESARLVPSRPDGDKRGHGPALSGLPGARARRPRRL